MISHEKLLSLLDYSRETGVFIWKSNRGGAAKTGTTAGTISRRDGYVRICVARKYILAHRLAWFYVTGEWTEFEVDHKNRNRQDNRFDNLRRATHQQNAWNSKIRTDNSSGFKGIDFIKRLGKWRVRLRAHGKEYSSTVYLTIEDAIEAHKKLSEMHHGEFSAK